MESREEVERVTGRKRGREGEKGRKNVAHRVNPLLVTFNQKNQEINLSTNI